LVVEVEGDGKPLDVTTLVRVGSGSGGGEERGDEDGAEERE
jgi:hypothetical protein